jgi:leucyl aminopeptidase (aminopeptidase T)
MPGKTSAVPTSLYSSVAKKILTESINAKKGDSITIESWNTGLDFARQVMIEARSMGCIPVLLFEDETAYIDGVKSSPPDSLGLMGKQESALLSGTDAYVFIPGPPIAVYSKSLTAEQKSRSTAYNSSWYEAAEKAKLRGVRMSFGYIGEDYSRLLHKPVAEIVKHQLNAVLVDFQEISSKGKEIASRLQDESEVSLLSGAGAKLSFRLKGDLAIEDGIVDENDVASGENIAYIPPGFVSKGIDPSSGNGKVRISPSITRLGMIEDSTLEFKDGKLVSYESKSGPQRKMLRELVESVPEVSRNLTQLTIGLNPKMKYGYGQDRFPRGSLGLAGFGFSCVARASDLSVSGNAIFNFSRLKAGRL